MPSPLTFNPFVSQYVAPPIDELKQVAGVLQDQYDKTSLGMDAVDTALGSIQTAPLAGDKLALQLAKQKYKQQLKALTERGDLENLQPQIRHLASQFEQDFKAGPLSQVAASHAAHQKYLEDRQKMSVSGKYGEWNDPWLAHQASGGLSADGQQYVPFTYQGMAEQQDHQKRVSDMMSDVAKSGFLGDYEMLDKAGNIVGRKQGWEGVADKTIRTLATQKAHDFLNTVEGQDFTRMVRHQNPKANVELEAVKALYTAGANQIGIQQTQGNSFKYAPEDLRKALDNELPVLPTTYAGDAASGADTSGEGDWKIDASGKLYQQKRSLDDDQSGVFAADYPGYKSTREDAPKEVQEEFNTYWKQLDGAAGKVQSADQAHKSFLDFKKQAADRQYYSLPENATAEVAEQLKQRLAPSGTVQQLLDGKQFVFNGKKYGSIDAFKEDMSGTFGDHELVNMLEGQKGYEKKDAYEINVRGSERANRYGLPGAYNVDVVDKNNGGVFKLSVQAPREIERILTQHHIPQVAEAAASGKPVVDVPLGKTADGKAKGYRVLSVVRPDTGKFMQTIQPTIDGKPVMKDGKPAQYPLEDFLNYQKTLADKELMHYQLGTSSVESNKGEVKGGIPSAH